ncbi:MAG: lipase [Gammaproteobacteria bacterium]
MKTTNLLIALLATGVLAACESEPGESLQNSIDTGNVSTFSPSDGVIPFPNNLLFRDSADGTLNIPVDDPLDYSDPQVALNTLDGFSTNAPFSAGFAGPIDAASAPAAVRVFEVVTNASGFVTANNGELAFGVDFVATASSINPADLVFVPLKPLKPKTSYQVVVTSALMSVRGNAMLPSTTYALAKNTSSYYTLPSGPRTPGLPQAFTSFSDADLADLEGLRLLINNHESTVTAAATNPALTTTEIILTWSFTTQSVDDVLAATRTQVRALTANATIATGPGTDSPLGGASMHEGTMDVPYFLTAASSPTDAAALDSFWKGAGGSFLTKFNTDPVSTSTQTIPVMISIPKSVACPANMPVTGWPVAIYQHGITRNRTDVMAVADSLANACIAAVAIDLPMHGGRTFDLDVVTQDASGNVTAFAGDGVADSLGINFINLQNLLNTRDNVRQGVSDLFAVVDAINEGEMDFGSHVMDPSLIYFVGHSLGAIVGTPFLALESDVRDAALAMGGSAVAKILDGSSSFGPVISGGLAANGVLKGTSDYESFLGAAQTVLDSSDPVNYSLDAASYAPSAANGRGLMFVEIVGDPVLGNPSDLTVPNTVPDANDSSGTIAAPLAGTEPQIALLGLTHVNATTAGADLLVATKFTSGYHGSLLDPSLDPLADAAVTTEIQTQIANFLGSDGAALVVTDATVLLAP